MNQDIFSLERIFDSLIRYGIVIASLSFHEWGHAFAACKLGDNTAKLMGRVTLNPLRHIDPIGTVLLPIIAILAQFPVVGWAKPVLINPDNLRRRGSLSLVTIAGPLMNLLLALVFAVACVIIAKSIQLLQ